MNDTKCDRLIIAVLLLCEFVVLGVIQQYNIYKKNCYFYLKKATIVLYVMLAIALAIWYNKWWRKEEYNYLSYKGSSNLSAWWIGNAVKVYWV